MQILNYIEKKYPIILTILSCILFIRQCSIINNQSSIKKEFKIINKKIDSLNKTLIYTEQKLKKDIAIEGLKSEKRMLQYVNRKIIDVQRQAKIDEEIKKLENE